MVNTRYDVSLFRKIVTGCWSPQTCSAFNVHAVMWRWTLRFGHKCCINLCQSFSESVCVFCLVIYFSCCVFWDIWGLGDPKLKVKKQNTKSATAWQGLIEHVCKQSRSIFQKRCGHLDFLCGKHLYFAWLPCDYIVSAWDQLWALNMTYCWPYVVRSRIFEYLRVFFYRHALEYLQSSRSEKNEKHAVFQRKA